MILVCFWAFGVNQAKAQCCTYTQNMSDTYGDSWNGGYLQIFHNNEPLGDFFATGSGSTETFSFCTGDTVVLLYTFGEYEEENSFSFLDAGYNSIVSEGPNIPAGEPIIIVVDCETAVIPGNHQCLAIPIDTLNCITESNLNVSGTGQNPGCAVYQGSDIWFVTQVPASGNLDISTGAGNINDTGIAAWTGNSCSGLTLVGCNDDNGIDYYSRLNLSDLTPGTNVYIQVFGYQGATGTFELCVANPGRVTVDSTELPLVLINTLNQTIVDDVKINARMEIKYNGLGNLTYLTDSANIYNGNIGIEIRGASSAGYPQRPYGFEFRDDLGNNLNATILGMPAENDWVLLSNYNDRSLLRNALAFKIFEGMGNYSVRSRLVEVLVDSSYKGIYLLGEKIKQDDNRVDIATLNSNENAGDELTGGYILQQNLSNETNSFLSNYSPIDHPELEVRFNYEEPSADSITEIQKDYIASYIDSLETALYNVNFVDSENGYRKYLDVKSFIDYFLVNELSRNNDGFKKSVFFNKDKFSNGGKLKAGPVWDFDWAWKNINGCSIFEATDGSGWAHLVNDCAPDNNSCGYYVRMLQDSSFANELKCAYNQYRETVLSFEYLTSFIDSVGGLVQNAQARHFQKWPILGISGPAPEVAPYPASYLAELQALKGWIDLRLNWLDENMPGNCYTNSTSLADKKCCSQISVFPNPAVNKIQFSGITGEMGVQRIKIIDLAGRTVDSINVKSTDNSVEIHISARGAYTFIVEGKAGLISTGKIVVVE
jgi:hypothetical protein